MKLIQHLSLLVVAIAGWLTLASCQQTQQSSKCLDDFVSVLLGCVKDSGLTEGNFLWFTTNGTSKRSEAPANPDAYKTQICGVQQQIGACTFQKVAAIINSTACVGTSASTNQQAAVSNQMTTIFGTYDMKCMHPCRTSLPNDLRACFSDNSLDPALFLSNSTNGAVIGSTKEQVTSFCAAKDSLVKCMQSKADACPEAAQILRAIDLDIPSFQKGVTVLCNHPEVYLRGLKCFAETTPEVENCKQKETQALMQLDSQARAGNWSEAKYSEGLCDVVLKQIECDLPAWSTKKHADCTTAVIGLRRELECHLIPSACNVNPQQIQEVNHACNPTQFNIDARANTMTGSDAAKTLFNAGVLLAGVTLVTSAIL